MMRNAEQWRIFLGECCAEKCKFLCNCAAPNGKWQLIRTEPNCQRMYKRQTAGHEKGKKSKNYVKWRPCNLTRFSTHTILRAAIRKESKLPISSNLIKTKIFDIHSFLLMRVPRHSVSCFRFLFPISTCTHFLVLSVVERAVDEWIVRLPLRRFLNRHQMEISMGWPTPSSSMFGIAIAPIFQKKKKKFHQL